MNKYKDFIKECNNKKNKVFELNLRNSKYTHPVDKNIKGIIFGNDYYPIEEYNKRIEYEK